jgi:hypothetical protein
MSDCAAADIEIASANPKLKMLLYLISFSPRDEGAVHSSSSSTVVVNYNTEHNATIFFCSLLSPKNYRGFTYASAVFCRSFLG